jgi:hypothetical protein
MLFLLLVISLFYGPLASYISSVGGWLLDLFFGLLVILLLILVDLIVIFGSTPYDEIVDIPEEDIVLGSNGRRSKMSSLSSPSSETPKFESIRRPNNIPSIHNSVMNVLNYWQAKKKND